MRFAFIGAGAVGGFYGALLARQRHTTSALWREARIVTPSRATDCASDGPLGDFTVKVRAESDPSKLGAADVVVLAVKTYDNATAIPMIRPLIGPDTVVLPLQNGVDSAEDIAAVMGEPSTLGGSTYIATAIEAPGVIRQTGTHERIVFGEYFGASDRVSDRVRRIADAMLAADIDAEAVADARAAVWEKFTYLAPFAAFTGASRLPIGPLWADEEIRPMFIEAVSEVRRVASRARHSARARSPGEDQRRTSPNCRRLRGRRCSSICRRASASRSRRSRAASSAAAGRPACRRRSWQRSTRC